MRRTQKEARRVVSVWQERLGLSDWEIEIDFSAPADDDANASIYICNDYKQATIHLGAGWERAPEPKFQRTMAHELLHCVTWGMRMAQKSLLYEGLLTRDVERLFEQRFNHEWERTVEKLAVIILAQSGHA